MNSPPPPFLHSRYLYMETSHWDNERLLLSDVPEQNYTPARLSAPGIQGLLYSHELIPMRCKRKRFLNCGDQDANTDCFSQLFHRRGNKDHSKDSGKLETWMQYSAHPQSNDLLAPQHSHLALICPHIQNHSTLGGGQEYSKGPQLPGKTEGTHRSCSTSLFDYIDTSKLLGLTIKKKNAKKTVSRQTKTYTILQHPVSCLEDI